MLQYKEGQFYNEKRNKLVKYKTKKIIFGHHFGKVFMAKGAIKTFLFFFYNKNIVGVFHAKLVK